MKGKWKTIRCLKKIETQQNIVDALWKQAEKKAPEFLKENKFTHIIDLNKISPQSHFDYYAEKEKDKWLIDVTINKSKDLIEKRLRLVDGYRCAILYIDNTLQKVRLVELKEVTEFWTRPSI